VQSVLGDVNGDRLVLANQIQPGEDRLVFGIDRQLGEFSNAAQPGIYRRARSDRNRGILGPLEEFSHAVLLLRDCAPFNSSNESWQSPDFCRGTLLASHRQWHRLPADEYTDHWLEVNATNRG